MYIYTAKSRVYRHPAMGFLRAFQQGTSPLVSYNISSTLP